MSFIKKLVLALAFTLGLVATGQAETIKVFAWKVASSSNEWSGGWKDTVNPFYDSQSPDFGFFSGPKRGTFYSDSYLKSRKDYASVSVPGIGWQMQNCHAFVYQSERFELVKNFDLLQSGYGYISCFILRSKIDANQYYAPIYINSSGTDYSNLKVDVDAVRAQYPTAKIYVTFVDNEAECTKDAAALVAYLTDTLNLSLLFDGGSTGGGVAIYSDVRPTTTTTSVAGHFDNDGIMGTLTYPNKYSVVFKDFDESIIQQSSVVEGGSVTPPDDPEREGYEFKGWSPDSNFDNITENKTFIATYEALGNSHTVTFMSEGEFFASQLVDDGGCAVPPTSVPTKEGHTLAGWLLDGQTYDFTTPVTVDITLDADFAINKYKVTFVDWEDKPIEAEPQLVEWKSAAQAPALPEVPEEYVFSHWSEDFSSVTEDLTVKAIIVPAYQYADSSNFAELVTDRIPEQVTIELTEDVTLTEWTAIDFRSTLEGAGHTIRGLTGPLFKELTGTVRNLVLDGLVGEAPTSIKFAADADYGVLANVVNGGVVENCTVSGFSISGGNTNGAGGIGLLAGRITNNSTIQGCTTAGEIRGADVVRTGGIAGLVVRTKDYLVDGVVVGIYNCTNHAVTTKSKTDYNTTGGCGGLVGRLDSGTGIFDGEFRFEIMGCLNDGALQGTVSGARLGGIVGGLFGDSDQNHIVVSNCVNLAEVSVGECKSSLRQQPVAGGIIGSVNGSDTFKGRLDIIACVNRGALDVGFDTEDVLDDGDTENYNKENRVAGGLIAAASLSKNGKMYLTDSANYGAVAGKWVGGLFGRHKTNSNYAYSDITIVNCANYGVLTGGKELDGGETLGGAGQVCARNSYVKLPTRVISNCYFMNDKLYFESEEGVEFTETNIFYPSTNEKATRKSLNLYAAEQGLSEWRLGKIGSKVYPELTTFCVRPYSDGIVLMIW